MWNAANKKTKIEKKENRNSGRMGWKVGIGMRRLKIGSGHTWSFFSSSQDRTCCNWSVKLDSVVRTNCCSCSSRVRWQMSWPWRETRSIWSVIKPISHWSSCKIDFTAHSKKMMNYSNFSLVVDLQKNSNLEEFLESLRFEIAILNTPLGLAYPTLDLLNVTVVLVADGARPLGFIIFFFHGG